MLTWFNIWKKIPVAEIKTAQHLEQANVVVPAKFVARQHPQKNSNCPILYVVGNVVYWGEVENFQVQQRRFYRTDKRGIEAALANLSPPDQREWKEQIKDILSAYFDRFDGQLVRLKKLTNKEVSITEEGHYCWRYAVELEAQSTGLNAPVEQQTRQFELLLSGETFQEITIKELREE